MPRSAAQPQKPMKRSGIRSVEDFSTAPGQKGREPRAWSKVTKERFPYAWAFILLLRVLHKRFSQSRICRCSVTYEFSLASLYLHLLARAVEQRRGGRYTSAPWSWDYLFDASL